MKTILFISILIVFSGCSSDPVSEAPTLSKEDINNIIEEYGNYLDSIGRNREFYKQFAVMEDTVAMDKLMLNLDISFHPNEPPFGNPPEFMDFVVHESEFNGFSIKNSDYINSLWAEENLKSIKPKVSYAITLPYSLKNSNIALVQEFIYPPIHTECIQERMRILLFKKENNKWHFLR